MSSTRARFCFCLAIALLAHALLLGWSSGASLPDGNDLLAATRAVGPASRPETTAVTATQNQRGDARASRQAAAAASADTVQTPRENASNAQPHVTRFVMVAERARSAPEDERPAPKMVVGAPQKAQNAQVLAAARDARAEYLADWQQRIEARGSRRYARELLAADSRRRLTMAVRIGADGSLRAVRVLRSSGNDALDAAALAIVRAAAPYRPFEPALAAATGELSFAYDWLFEPDDLQAADERS